MSLNVKGIKPVKLPQLPGELKGFPVVYGEGRGTAIYSSGKSPQFDLIVIK